MALDGDHAMIGAYGENVQAGAAYAFTGLSPTDCNASSPMPVTFSAAVWGSSTSWRCWLTGGRARDAEASDRLTADANDAGPAARSGNGTVCSVGLRKAAGDPQP